MPVTVPTQPVLASSLTITIQTHDDNPDSDPMPFCALTLDSTTLSQLEDSDVDAITAVYTARAEQIMPTLTIQHVRQWSFDALAAEDPVDDYEPAAGGEQTPDAG